MIHRREVRKPTNTGALAAACLTNSQVWVRGHRDGSDQDWALEPNAQTLLLFPHERAGQLQSCVDPSRPCTLVVPDGTWRQAVKVGSRVPSFAQVPWVTLPPGPPTLYRLRQESHPQGLATMEAIARAFGILEGPAIQEALERVFRLFVERTLWARGSLDASDVQDGLPAGVKRHIPSLGQNPDNHRKSML